MLPLKPSFSLQCLPFTPTWPLLAFRASPKRPGKFIPPSLHFILFHETSLVPVSEMFQSGGAPRSTDNRQEQILVNENKELKAKIKELQKVMDTELQNTDDQFLEKIKELEADHTRKIEEMEAFSFLVAQEAEVTSSFLLTPQNSKFNIHQTKLNSPTGAREGARSLT